MTLIYVFGLFVASGRSKCSGRADGVSAPARGLCAWRRLDCETILINIPGFALSRGEPSTPARPETTYFIVGMTVKFSRNLFPCCAAKARGGAVLCRFFENVSFVSHYGGTNFYARNNQQNH